jgi:hypothetical protein
MRLFKVFIMVSNVKANPEEYRSYFSRVNSIYLFLSFFLVLARIFQRIGIDVEHKQLDSRKKALAMKLTNELINNNIHISNVDLEKFIQLYLDYKQLTGSNNFIDNK